MDSIYMLYLTGFTGLSGFILGSYFSILSILLILSENGLSMPLSFLFDQTDRFLSQRRD